MENVGNKAVFFFFLKDKMKKLKNVYDFYVHVVFNEVRDAEGGQ